MSYMSDGEAVTPVSCGDGEGGGGGEGEGKQEKRRGGKKHECEKHECCV